MPVICPHCSSRYLLPQALLGPGGARVRCPRCREPFAVTPAGEASALPKDAQAPAVAPTPDPSASVASVPASAAEAPMIEASTNGAPPLWTAPVAEAAAAPPAPLAPVFEMPMLVIAEPAASSAPAEIVRGFAMPAEPAKETAAAHAEITVSRTTDPSDPIEIARAVLDELSSHSGEAMAISCAEGRLFREFGAVIGEAYEFYRRRVGSGADAAPFRAALKERWGVDLDPPSPAGRIF